MKIVSNSSNTENYYDETSGQSRTLMEHLASLPRRAAARRPGGARARAEWIKCLTVIIKFDRLVLPSEGHVSRATCRGDQLEIRNVKRMFVHSLH